MGFKNTGGVMKATWSWKTALVIVGSLVFLWGGQALGQCYGPPNTICEPENGEDCMSCSPDCGCGDGVCDLISEPEGGPCGPPCPIDCPVFGCMGPPNTICQVGNDEDRTNCFDCFCGDDICDADETIMADCPIDCAGGCLGGGAGRVLRFHWRRE